MASFVFHWGLLQKARERAFTLPGYLRTLQKERSRCAWNERKRLDPQSPVLMMPDTGRVLFFRQLTELYLFGILFVLQVKKRPKDFFFFLKSSKEIKFLQKLLKKITVSILKHTKMQIYFLKYLNEPQGPIFHRLPTFRHCLRRIFVSFAGLWLLLNSL